MSDLQGPKWDAARIVFTHFGQEPDDTFASDFVRKGRDISVETMRLASMEWTSTRLSPPPFWSHYAKLFPPPETKPKGQPRAPVSDPETQKTNDPWWGNEGEWGGDWSRTRGLDMIIPAAVMTTNLNEKATSNYRRNRVGEFVSLAKRRGAPADLIDRAIAHLRSGRGLNQEALDKLATDPDFFTRKQELVAA